MKFAHKLATTLALFVLLTSSALAATLAFQTYTTAAYVPVSVAAGSPIPIGTLERKAIALEGVGTATYQVQLSLDSSVTPASTSWQNEGAALTTSGTLEITKPAAWLRLNVTTYTNGTPTLRVVGLQRQ